MASTFIALPLSNGEAFLLRTSDENGREWSILVDSGKKYGEKSRELAKVLAQVSPTIERIDIAICTHSDADHSQGFWYFAEDWYDLGRTIGEFWLPGRWANAMPAILTDPAGFASTLLAGSREAADRIEEFGLFAEGEDARLSAISREFRYRELSGVIAEKSSDFTASGVRVVGEGHDAVADLGSAFALTPRELALLRADAQETDDVTDPLVTAMQHAAAAPSMVVREWLDHEAAWITVGEPASLEATAAFREVAETAEAIRRIALAAVERKIRVRWFDFGEYVNLGRPSGGVPGLLEPLCSVEVVPDRTKAMRLSALALFTNLRLSRQNVESLVFYRPETASEPGALFLGDSRLAHGIERPENNFPIPFEAPERRLLVSVPHHGSDHNDRAYEVLDNWLSSKPYFVRNGGQSNQQLGDYLNQPERRCAQCVQCNGKTWNQWVAVNTDGQNWKWPPSANPCGTPKI